MISDDIFALFENPKSYAFVRNACSWCGLLNTKAELKYLPISSETAIENENNYRIRQLGYANKVSNVRNLNKKVLKWQKVIANWYWTKFHV